MSVEEENKALCNRRAEAISGGDLDAIDELYVPDLAQQIKQRLAEIRRAFPDYQGANIVQIAEGEWVANRFVFHGTFLGDFEGLSPTGERVTFEGIAIDKVVEGKIVDSWADFDVYDLLDRRLMQEQRKRELIEQELRLARSIQQASLPNDVPALDGWRIDPFYQPAREVGGDFYDFHLLSEGRLGIVVGDATGKGVPAALVMSTTCGMLQAVSRAFDSSSPGAVLQQVNETLFARIPANMFVTCFYAILEPESGTLIYANAGHDLPYLRRHGGECEELRARGMPLGIMPGRDYEQKEVVLDAREAALFYSDGLVEAHDPEGEMFGFPRLRALFGGLGDERSVEEALLEELYSFVGEGWEQEDDITLLTLRRSAYLS